MKRIIYLITVVFLGSCSTTQKTITVSKAVPIPPAGITFTEINNFRGFTSLQKPYQGSGFEKQESGSYNDAGEEVPISKYKGTHVYQFSDLSSMFTIDGDKTDINNVLESYKKSILIRTWLKKDNIIEQYSDVVIGGKTCKRVFIHFNMKSNNYEAEAYTLGYLFQNNETTAFFYIDKAKSSPEDFEQDLKVVDSALKYMVETVEFREYKK